MSNSTAKSKGPYFITEHDNVATQKEEHFLTNFD